MSTTLSDSCKEPDLLLSPTSTLCQSPTAFTGSGMFTFPRLEISSLDTSPFSNSFSGLIKEELITWRQDANAANDQDTSYDIERFTNMKELVPEWDDEDVDEILIMCPKSDRQLTPIEEEPARPDVPQSISLTDFIALPDYLQGSQGPPLYRKHDTGRLYVLKSFPSRASKPACERDVLEILGDVKAPFLPRICWSFWDDDSFCMVLEYYSQETIADIVRSGGALKPERAHFFACEIIQALTSLHATGIVHRDLRPENIIIDNAGHVVVDGFGSSELLPPSSKARGQGRVFCMTAASTVSVFCAPEMLLGWSHDYVVDTWGFGVLLLFMVSGRVSPAAFLLHPVWTD
ncbi:hypothetical protein DXG01_009153 [Tephrocybe rancida]|nr:hypothetical protein DXG01_009153 [Tephrocybe rancida]